MNRNSSWAAGKVLAAAILTLTVTLMMTASASASTYKNLYTFTGGADGGGPSGLVIDAAGNLYGATANGGAFGYGTVFKLDTAGTFTVLYSFKGGIDGANPSGYESLTLDPAGNLYGTTSLGGAFGYGTVFKLDTSGVETVLYSFGGGTDGGTPTGRVALDQPGNVYGTTTRGGNSYGVLFKLTPNLDGTWSETVLHSFPAYSGDAAEDYGGVDWGPDGNLYGATWQGGTGGGTIFKSDTAGNEAVVHSFSGSEGEHLYKPPTFDVEGNLYVGTIWGGDFSCYVPGWGEVGCGTVVKLDPAGNPTVLHTFTGGKDGECLVGGLTLDQTGNLYGTAQLGGAYGDGVVFMGTPNHNGGFQGKVLHTFAGHPGAEPISTMVSDAKGNLYGTTVGNPGQSYGSIFVITP